MDALEENGVYEATQAVETAASDFIWRRMHGLPMLHRNKSCRHIQSFHHNIVTR